MRVILAFFILTAHLYSTSPVVAQSPNGSIRGIVLDPDSRSIPGAEIIVVSDATGVKYITSTNGDGLYAIENLPPGPYRIQVSKFGFKAIIKPDLILNVQDALSLNFTLPLGATSVVVTVEGGAPLVNTTDATVSTVVDRKFVESMPLNGRSFQDLILLTPGVVTNNPTLGAGEIGQQGEFSVNGQRTESNYYMVDGVSANIGTIAGGVAAPSNSGSLPASTALGTTQGLVSVDALQEFRIQSSSYSAEYGRNPGGQFSFVTRSGTDEWHGTVFDYLRNDAFDANDWFNNADNLPKPALRQNDFGGTLGGYLKIPHVYDGKNKTFFFVSYEGLRLLQPQEASTSYVPTTALRASSPTSLQPMLNAFPLPLCPAGASGCTTDLGNGLGDFVGSWSNPSSIDTFSLRLDHNWGEKLRLFFRFADTSSSQSVRLGGQFGDPANPVVQTFLTRTYTGGVTTALTAHAENDFRVNFSSNGAVQSARIDDFGGAQSVDLLVLQGLTEANSNLSGTLSFSDFAYNANVSQQQEEGFQSQWNLVDTFSTSIGRHGLKFGADYRRLAPHQNPYQPLVDYNFYSEDTVLANNADFVLAQTQAPAFPLYRNFSLFGQDEWRISRALTLSFGLRWEVNPAPGTTKGPLPYTLTGNINDLNSLALAPQGTPLWQTSWHNVAPRFGAAYLFHDGTAFLTVLRGGFGVFYDTGQQQGSTGYQGPGFSASSFLTGGFPLPAAAVTPLIINPPVAPYPVAYGFAPDLQLPLTLQWNTSIQQGLGKSQSLTISYVGSNGRRLLENEEVNPSLTNPNFQSYVLYYQNGLTSDYNALQVQFQRRLLEGLQLLASYTWAHSIDYGSRDAALPYQRGDSDFDVRNTFSSAVSYELPNAFHGRFASVILHHWGLDDRFSVRSGFPLQLDGFGVTDPATGRSYQAGLDRVPGESIYIYGPQFPGGRSVNPAAFAEPASGALGTNPRNSVRGFGASQMDVAVRREFPIHERLKLQFRAEAFNVFNHPNFGAINQFLCPPGPFCTFGQAIQSLNQSLGVLSPLYQMGGARSFQFASRLAF